MGALHTYYLLKSSFFGVKHLFPSQRGKRKSKGKKERKNTQKEKGVYQHLDATLKYWLTQTLVDSWEKSDFNE